MVVIQLKRDEYLVHKNEPMKAIYIIIRGSIVLKTRHSEMDFGAGSVIGFIESISGSFGGDYIAKEDCLVASYKYENSDDFKTIFKEQPKYCYAFLHAAVMECKQIYEKYVAVEKKTRSLAEFVTKQYAEYEVYCSHAAIPVKEITVVGMMQQFCLPEIIRTWEMDYLHELFELPEKDMMSFYNHKERLCIGEIMDLSDYMNRMLADIDAMIEFMEASKEYLICEEDDLLELWYDLSLNLAYKGINIIMPKVRVRELAGFLKNAQLFGEATIDARFRYYTDMNFEQYVLVNKLVEDTKESEETPKDTMTAEEILAADFVTYIMEYAGYEAEEITNVKRLVRIFDATADSVVSTEDGTKVRKELTKVFYEIYEKAFLRAVNEHYVPTILELFFQFGIMDVGMVGKENVRDLIDTLKRLNEQMKMQEERKEKGEIFTTVYSIYQWLRSIYRGEKEPSKNEFDVDYNGQLLEQRKHNTISKEQENELKHDRLKKVKFEIQNMFANNNRLTYGRVTDFCPVLHRKDFVRTAGQMFISFEKINEIVDAIRMVDYSCFFREVLFVAPEHGIDRTQIMKEVLPDVILMPNIGSRAMMWQETSGVKRDTSARFILPIMTIADLTQLMLETIGKYRWEICRKIMGVRWNDIRDKSLTSEYYDYIQYYRKNSELSSSARDKIKADLVHAKNNYRDVFVMDYVNWMKFEVQGNFRLNKVSRRILSDYVPFPAEIRNKLSVNPMYKELFAKGDILRKRKKDKEKVLFDRYLGTGGKLTPELEAHLQFYDM
uniref:hypothetical protein n=1 Tax=Agathobacter sp. TaxID=2021311 RepID=UPI004055E221